MNVLSTAQNIASEYAALGDFIGLCTGVPGNTSTVFNEAAGGTPGYARQATTWTENTNGTVSGSVVILNLPAGTYPYMIVCSAATGNNMIDWIPLATPIVIGAQQAVPITPGIVFN